MAFYDRSGKWLSQHFGASLLWLGGEQRQVVSCRAAQAEVVLPAKLPDGLFEVEFAGSTQPELHLSEQFIYPDRRAVEQIVRDIEVVDADRGEVPEVSVLTLRPLGHYRIPDGATRVGRSGGTRIQLKWTTRELWHLPAAELLARNDPGLIPWVALCRTSRSPQSLLTECRRRIEQTAAPQEQEALLVTTCIYADLRFDDVDVFKLLIGDRKMFTETPLIQELFKERDIKAKIEDISAVIEFRFGAIPEELHSKLELIEDVERLSELLQAGLACESLKAFERELE